MPIHSRARRVFLAAAAGLLAIPGSSWAHAILEDSSPEAGAKVPPGPVALRLRFNSRIDRGRSGLTLTRPDQTRTALKIDPEGAPNVLTTTVTLTPGNYVVRWQVLAVDGHITRGDVPFTVSGN